MIAQVTVLRIIENLQKKENFMFWQIYLMLCMERGLSANAVAKELSIASGTVSEWKKGRMPQNATLKRVAEFFGVSLDFLLGKT